MPDNATDPQLNLVLYAPRIPQNTGQLARACHAMDCRLHLVRPLGFRMDAAGLRRASVGYLSEMDIPIHADGEAFWGQVPTPARVWMITKYGARDYCDVPYQRGDWLLMGSETEGLPEDWLKERPDQTVAIAMPNPQVRCLNLATAATAVMFEALRQIKNI